MSAFKSGTDPMGRVFDFNYNVVGVEQKPLAPLSTREGDWLRSAVIEEADELIEAYYVDGGPTLETDPRKVTIGQVDACVDAAIFAIGGLARLGLTADQARACFDAVMDANFEKKAGVKAGRSGAKDAVKPEGWVGPEERIKEILYGNG